MKRPLARAASLLLLTAFCVAGPALAAPPAADPAAWVDPLVGTARMGHTYPGATVPFGFVQLSPDTRRVTMYDADGRYTGEAYPYCAGYQHADSTIVGFSHTHFSGTGHSDLGDILAIAVLDHGQRAHGNAFAVKRARAGSTADEGIVDQDRKSVV